MKDRTTGGGGTVSYREKAKGSVVVLMHTLYSTALTGMELGHKDMQSVSRMERRRIELATVT